MTNYNKNMPDFKQLNDRLIAEPSPSPSIGAVIGNEKPSEPLSALKGKQRS
ncbi:hypothetical protein J9317_11360 [Metabacillus sp. KIGAM252]|uniref:Multidrug transporter n=1 Tax=Metabacillus flavus TaxID=2823519 RepID=A0ABS5LFR9_9BACI|nr:hypothetical protein [Metabacillus flavus]MBS2969363.1 hypothetical protein [Metabacillus flavus]